MGVGLKIRLMKAQKLLQQEMEMEPFERIRKFTEHKVPWEVRVGVLV
jgi:hypothetical protein